MTDDYATLARLDFDLAVDPAAVRALLAGVIDQLDPDRRAEVYANPGLAFWRCPDGWMRVAHQGRTLFDIAPDALTTAGTGAALVRWYEEDGSPFVVTFVAPE